MRCFLVLSACLVLLAGCGDPAETTLQGVDTIAKARVMRAGMEIRQLRTEVEQHHVLRGEWPSPSSQLLRTAIDPWDNPYVVEFEESRAFVSSAGPDGEIGTADDILGEE